MADNQLPVSDPQETSETGQPLSGLSQLEKELSDLSAERDALKSRQTALEKRISRERDELIGAKRKEVAGEFDRQLRAADNDIRSMTEKRQKARAQGVKARIAERTDPYRAEQKELRTKLTNLFRDRHVPAFLRSGWFYALTMPSGFSEYLTALLCFLLVFGVIPFVANILIPGSAVWHWVVIYLVVIVVFGGIYLFLSNQKVRYLETVREGRVLRSAIRSNQKQIKKISGAIRRDRDDTVYDLRAYDDMLSKRNQEREEISLKRAQALEQFDAVTRNVLSDEVRQKYEADQEALTRELDALSVKTKELEERIGNYGKTSDNQGTV